MRPVFFVICLISGMAVFEESQAQQPLLVQWQLQWGASPLALNASVPDADGKDSLHISMLRFYISGISLLQDSISIWSEPSSYHLLDASEPGTLKVALSVPSGVPYNRLRFYLGIDSATNAAGAQGGDLDPVRGMYWAWQSGYINLKIEGTSLRCATRKHQFQYHLGGFRDGGYCMQTVTLPVYNRQGPFVIQTDVSAFFKAFAPEQQPSVMVPGADAVRLAGIAARMFIVGP